MKAFVINEMFNKIPEITVAVNKESPYLYSHHEMLIILLIATYEAGSLTEIIYKAKLDIDAILFNLLELYNVDKISFERQSHDANLTIDPYLSELVMKKAVEIVRSSRPDYYL